MCRLLVVKSAEEFFIGEHLSRFARVAQNSKEYQGHGWGCAYLQNNAWRIYKHIKPIWEDEFRSFGKTRLLVAHARSAFQDNGITVDNNMPFRTGDLIFIFNGELHGVKIKSEGRIGAEKIFNYILRFRNGNLFAAFNKALDIIQKRTRYIRAMNILMTDTRCIYLASQFNDDPDYFTLHQKRLDNGIIICSEPYPGESDWKKLPNKTRKVISHDDY